jgi:VIT1/CCC1 family predicted Fe2+/Mn2+ transporter
MAQPFEERMHIEGGDLIRQIVLGANDGIVSIFALLAGVAGANLNPITILISLLAATVAGALSMAVGEFVSSKSERNYFENEINKERLEIKLVPHIEREELKLIYKKKGFSGEILEQIIEKITTNDELWVREMIIDELGVAEIEQKKEIKGTIIVFFAFVLGAIFPTLPYMIFQALPEPIIIFWIATALTFFGLFFVGAMKKYITGVNWLKSGFELLIAGTFAFGVSYLIGLVLGVSV